MIEYIHRKIGQIFTDKERWHMEASFRQQHPDGFGKDRYSCMRQTGPNSTSPHWHDCVEMIYMEKGTMRFYYMGEWITLGAGELIFIPPGRIHYTDCLDPEAEKLVVGFENSVITPSDGSINVKQYQIPLFTYALDSYIHFPRQEAEEIGCGTVLREFEACLTYKETAYELYAHGLLLLLYTRIYRNWIKRGMPAFEEDRHPLLWEILQKIQTLYAIPLSPYEIADQLHISYSWLNSLFNRTMHTGFNAYLNSVRLREAEKLLLTTDETMTEIAQKTGYGDSSYFIRQFRKTYRCTPLQYRLQVRRGE